MNFKIIKEKCFSRARWRQAVVCVSCQVGLLLMLAVGSGCRDSGDAMLITGEAGGQTALSEEFTWFEEETNPLEDSAAESIAEEPVTASTIYVHICGQVVMPGVYLLPEASRVWDAVEAAGGFVMEAAAEAVNLAMMIEDGSKITIPDQEQAEESDFRWYETGSGKVMTIGGEVEGEKNITDDLEQSDLSGGIDGGAGRATGRIDINRADEAMLMTIPGIGQARAEAIVSYRETRGPFGSIEEIMEVTGIKEGLFAQIREYITVGG